MLLQNTNATLTETDSHTQTHTHTQTTNTHTHQHTERTNGVDLTPSNVYVGTTKNKQEHMHVHVFVHVHTPPHCPLDGCSWIVSSAMLSALHLLQYTNTTSIETDSRTQIHTNTHNEQMGVEQQRTYKTRHIRTEQSNRKQI